METALVRLPAQSEKSFAKMVKQAAALYRWEMYFTYTSIHSPKGFPDLVLCRPPRLLIVELKRNGAKPTPDQERWLELLGQVPGVEAYLWKPSDWDSIVAALQ
jgi:hypothetical protein